VTPDDLESQVEFWSTAGYDFIPLTVGMMQPGKVTKESKISKVTREVMLADSADADKEEPKDDRYARNDSRYGN
jgi:uroporphyrinogen decarboxylase